MKIIYVNWNIKIKIFSKADNKPPVNSAEEGFRVFGQTASGWQVDEERASKHPIRLRPFGSVVY